MSEMGGRVTPRVNTAASLELSSSGNGLGPTVVDATSSTGILGNGLDLTDSTASTGTSGVNEASSTGSADDYGPVLG